MASIVWTNRYTTLAEKLEKEGLDQNQIKRTLWLVHTMIDNSNRYGYASHSISASDFLEELTGYKNPFTQDTQDWGA